MPFLEETIKYMEQDIGLTFEEINNMDLCKITEHINKKRTRAPRHIPRFYRKARNIRASQGRFITEEKHEKTMNYLMRKYCPATFFDKIKSFIEIYMGIKVFRRYI